MAIALSVFVDCSVLREMGDILWNAAKPDFGDIAESPATATGFQNIDELIKIRVISKVKHRRCFEKAGM